MVTFDEAKARLIQEGLDLEALDKSFELSEPEVVADTDEEGRVSYNTLGHASFEVFGKVVRCDVRNTTLDVDHEFLAEALGTYLEQRFERDLEDKREDALYRASCDRAYDRDVYAYHGVSRRDFY